MAKVTFHPSIQKRKGYVMTTRDLCWEKNSAGEYVRVSDGKRGRPAKVRAVCVRWKYGQAYTYGWNPSLKREATEGMKRSQGLMQQATAMAKEIWKDAAKKAHWQQVYERHPGQYKSAWLMLVGECIKRCKEKKPAAVRRASMARVPYRSVDARRGCSSRRETLGRGYRDRYTTPNVPIKIGRRTRLEEKRAPICIYQKIFVPLQANVKTSAELVT